MRQFITDPAFWKSVCAAAIIILVGMVIFHVGKKPTRSQLLFRCHKEFMELQNELSTIQFIDVDYWSDRIWVFKMKWAGRVDKDILQGYVDQLKLYTRQTPLEKDSNNSLTAG